MLPKVKRVFLTGMSGTGKSAVISELAARGYKSVDTDYDGWSELVDLPANSGQSGFGGGQDWLWREDPSPVFCLRKTRRCSSSAAARRTRGSSTVDSITSCCSRRRRRSSPSDS